MVAAVRVLEFTRLGADKARLLRAIDRLGVWSGSRGCAAASPELMESAEASFKDWPLAA